MTPDETTQALNAARALVAAGVPVFAAPPNTDGPNGAPNWKVMGGYRLPSGWEHTQPDLAQVDAWKPGWALCAVMGHTVDGLDIDTHKGGMDSLTELATAGALPTAYAIARTPSGGAHLLIAPTGCRSRDGFAPGLDLKAGAPDGQGRGFLFIAPTVKPSKVTGELRAYRWDQYPALDAVTADAATAALASVVEAARAGKAPATPTTDAADMDPEHVAAYCKAVVDAIAAELNAAAGWDEGHTDNHGRGWEKLVADAAWRLASVGITPGSGIDLAEAEALFVAMVPDAMANTDTYTASEKWKLQSRRAEPIHVPPPWGPEAFGLSGVPTPDVAASEITGPPALPGLVDVFDPPVLQEDDLARAVLAASWPLYRFATDEKAWYRREDARGRWERDSATPLDCARSIIARVGTKAPRGNKNADTGTPERLQAERWGMLHTSAKRGSVAKLMADTADTGELRAADMDADAKTLWAGGYCWDLARSAHTLTLAPVDLLTPHQHSAAVLPRVVPTPRWDAMLAAIFPDAEERDYLMGVLGAATTGTSDRILGVFYGDRLRGKTSILKVVSEVLGTYARALDPDLLDARRSNDFKVMSLKGIRLGWVDEGPSNNRLGQERLKALTGGGTLVGAVKGKQAVPFGPTHTLFFTDNREPDVSDEALRSRVRALRVNGDPAEVKVAVKAIRSNMAEWLATEGPGVLAQLIMWAGRYLADDTVADMPEHIRVELEALGREQDPVLSWLDERTEPVGETSSTELYADFRAHAEASGVPRSLVPNLTTWGRKLSDMGHLPRKANGVKVRPLTLRQRYGTMGWNTPPQLSATVPQLSPQLSLDQTVPETSSVSGTVTVPTVPELSPTETPSQTPVRDSRDSRDSIKGGRESEKGGKRGVGACEAHIRACARETVPTGGPDGVALPAVLQRGGRPFAIGTDDARALLATLAGQRVTLDVETSGYPVGHMHYRPKTIQLGNRHWAVVLDAGDPAHVDVACAAMDAAGELQAHSATADVSLVALAAGRDSAPWWDKATDTAVLAALAPADLTGLHKNPKALGLKELSAKLLEAPVAPEADKARAALFRRNKWLTNPDVTTPPERNGWHEVDPAEPVMVTYAASDVLDTDDVRTRLPDPPAPLMARERRLQGVLARLPERGLKLDAERVAELKAHHEAERDKWADALKAHGVDDPGSNTKLGRALIALGADLPATATGKPSTAAATIERLAEHDGPARQLAQDLLAYREHEKLLSTYLTPFSLQCTHGDGRARPTILTLGAAATGRMCLPTTHHLLTDHGAVAPDDVRPGMRTLDASGAWVEVLDVHRYSDAPVTTHTARGMSITATDEHRWVTTLEHRPGDTPQLRALGERPRLRVHLAPDTTWVPGDAPYLDTPGQRFAALVGALVTDGRCVERDNELRAYLYQTERKHLHLWRQLAAPGIMYDRVTTGDHHELRLSARWLRPQLSGFTLPGAGLRCAPELHTWAARLPLDELQSFLSVVWLADGHGQTLSCGNPALADVVSLAAYRLGWVARHADHAPGGWGTKPRHTIALRRPVLTTHRAEVSTGTSDVWCVTTTTGTFTARHPDGMVYLTGNSSVRPNIQQVPRDGGMRAMFVADDGHAFIAADFSSVEVRIAAAITGDATLAHMVREGIDLHGEVVKLAWGLSPEDPIFKAVRYDAKRAVFGYLYGAGLKTVAKQLGAHGDKAQAVVDALKAITPQLIDYDRGLRRAVETGTLSKWVHPSGRTAWFNADQPHKSLNMVVQGYGRELLVDAIERWESIHPGCTITPIHDELLIQVPEADAEQWAVDLGACMTTTIGTGAAQVPIVAEVDPPTRRWGSVEA